MTNNGAKKQEEFQSCYLDKSLRQRLDDEHSVRPCVIVQCLGDVVLIPAMAPYQASFIHSSVLVLLITFCGLFRGMIGRYTDLYSQKIQVSFL